MGAYTIQHGNEKAKDLAKKADNDYKREIARAKSLSEMERDFRY